MQNLNSANAKIAVGPFELAGCWSCSGPGDGVLRGTDVLCLRACRVAVAACVPEKFGNLFESFDMILKGMVWGAAVAYCFRPAVECWSARVWSISSKLGTFL